MKIRQPDLEKARLKAKIEKYLLALRGWQDNQFNFERAMIARMVATIEDRGSQSSILDLPSSRRGLCKHFGKTCATRHAH
jgi:hypothetical protein